jgi:hypothetical protein
MIRTNFTNNSAPTGGQGGTICALDPRDAEFIDCIWSGNTAYQGAGIYASRFGGKADWSFTRCSFFNNTADQRGAAIWTTGMNYTFTNTTFESNSALLGAGVYATNSGTELPLSMTFTQCQLQGNFAEQSAGVAWLKGYKNVSFDECRMSANSAGQSAGAVYLQNTPAQITASVLAGNTARLAAALMLQGSSSAVQVTDSRLEGNKVCVIEQGAGAK